MQRQRIRFTASKAPAAVAALAALTAAYGQADIRRAEVVVALGGDGFMLQTLHAAHGQRLPVYGMNCGTIGFLMNAYALEDLPARLAAAEETSINPLSMRAETTRGKVTEALAINEVSLLRETRQTAKLEVSLNDRVVMAELVCDGVLVSTPAGSTAYNLSAQGPILPLGSGLLALTPISPFRPRRWRGAILPETASVSIRVLDAVKRPVSAVADQREVRDVRKIDVAIDRAAALTFMFDPEHALDDRITMEQFVV